ncbi:MAG: serine/threonine protein kinase [Deltaproteobacteria bacterium]|nr:serine/threonine protein kinase [Deltaproteobacteria bacterium]
MKSKAIVVAASLGAMVITALGVRASVRDFDAAPWGRVLEGRLRETGAALHARVATLAELPTLAAAVSTDSGTVRDLTQDELAFRPRRGETVAIAQLPTKGPPVILLALPSLADAPPITGDGKALLRIVAGHLVISEAIRVVPRERADELQGVVAASQQVEVEDLSRKLAARGIGASVVVEGQKLDLFVPSRESAANARQFDVPVESPSSAAVHLILVPAAEATGAPYWFGAAGLVLVAAFFARRSRSADSKMPTLPSAPAVWTPAATPAATLSPAHRAAPPNVLVGATGRTIGRYQIIRHIGTGGMADVYLAHATGEAGFTKKIALKVLERSFARQKELVEHFLDEARLATMLDHPNIVQIIDLGRADDEYFIAMEYVDGADLARLIEITTRQGRPIPLSVVVAILRKVCDGLHAAHTIRAADGAPLGLVHRDMKCGNVFVARNGVVKIGDFGIAMTNHASRVTRTQIGLVKGTPGYMAPEHRLGQTIDGRADLYGVGAIGYELLTGVLVNLDFPMLAQRGRTGWPHLAPLQQVRQDVPDDLQAVIFRALSYDAADRFADGAAMEAALETIARQHPPVANDKTIGRWMAATLAEEQPITLVAASPRPGQD